MFHEMTRKLYFMKNPERKISKCKKLKLFTKILVPEIVRYIFTSNLFAIICTNINVRGNVIWKYPWAEAYLYDLSDILLFSSQRSQYMTAPLILQARRNREGLLWIQKNSVKVKNSIKLKTSWNSSKVTDISDIAIDRDTRDGILSVINCDRFSHF